VWICIAASNSPGDVESVLHSAFGILDGEDVEVALVADERSAPVLRARFGGDRRIHVLDAASGAGLAAAYDTAFRFALGNGASIVVQIDADGSHDPRDLPRLLAALRTADVAIGSRYVAGSAVSGGNRARRLVGRLGSLYTQRVLALRVSDTSSAFKCFRRAALQVVTNEPLGEGDYGVHVEVTQRAAHAALRIAELPITVHESAAARPRRARFADGRIVPFVGVGLVGAATGYATLVSTVELLGWSPHLAFLLSSIVSFETNFLLNDRFTWGDRRQGSTKMRRRVKFHAGRWLSFPLSQLVFSVLVVAGLWYVAASVAVVLLVSSANYVISDRWVFGRRRRRVEAEVPRPAERLQPVDDALPPVSVVIPVRNSAGTLNSTVRSVLSQNYEGPLEVIVVGSPNDESWAAVPDEIAAGTVIAYEVEVETRNRDTPVKRTLGFDHASGRILCSIDSDTFLASDWISTAVGLIGREGWDGVAGPCTSLDQDFWGEYVDRNRFGSKTPRMDNPYVFDAGTLGRRGHKMPVTGCAVFTDEVWSDVGGFDKDFVDHYDDYEYFQRVAERGFRILCTPELRIGLHHRSGFKALVKEYWESGSGCGQFVRKFPRSKFSAARVRQLALVVLGCAAAVAFPLYALYSVAAGAVVLGLASWRADRRWRASAYPLITLGLGLVFASAMAFRLAADVVHAPRTRIGRHRRVGVPGEASWADASGTTREAPVGDELAVELGRAPS
jgi:dolichol-phosphate mannosyltransferase